MRSSSQPQSLGRDADAAPTILGMVVMPFVHFKLMRPEVTAMPNAPADARASLARLGGLTRDQKAVSSTFIGLVTLWGAAASLGVDSTAVALLGLGILLATGVLTLGDIAKEGDVLATYIWFAALFVMSDQLNTLGFMEFLGNRLGRTFRPASAAQVASTSKPW